MNNRIGRMGAALLVAGLIFIGLLAIQGCKQEQPEPTAGTHTHGEGMDQPVHAELAEATEQTRCPVMDAPINKELFVEYKGKKVYFCCKGCEDKFNAEPEKYVAKLPQFQP